MTTRLVLALLMLAAAGADMASARDRSAGSRDRRCDPDARVNAPVIDACSPYAYNPTEATRAPDPSKASEPAFPLEMPPIGSALTPRRP